MTISYNWLSDYIPSIPNPEELSAILTAVGLEVESMERFESLKGGLSGLIVGEVLTCQQHPNADKLKITTVNTGSSEPLQIVCGASNVAVGQKVIVAPVGATIYPVNGSPVTMKNAKIRGTESQGMICAEDEIGVGTSHEGILVLPAEISAGLPASDYFKPYNDFIYEIGLTPNRMDAMSHYGVARDVCAYLSYHNKAEVRAISPFNKEFAIDNHDLDINITVENNDACWRYSGVSITGITVQESPAWLKNKLLSIGLRPINNVVDITNFILHETGQPLHAFDAAEVTDNLVVVKNLPEGSTFVTLDGKERKLSSEDLMICNSETGMCIAGVFGGLTSGVNAKTTSVFLESACFNPISIRRTSLRHGLRTDAATRFEKGVDISNTVNVLKRAATMIKEIAGGSISGEIRDIYPVVRQKTLVDITYVYLAKLSGKKYSPDGVKSILTALGFEIVSETAESLKVAVPFSKVDISIPADIVEEVLRIDGLDNVEIKGSITIRPAVDENAFKETLKEKISSFLTGQGFSEIVTNSITNSNYFSAEQLGSAVKMINSLSADLDVLRPSMIESGLEAIVYNANRKQTHLQFFEIGKTYHQHGVGNYDEPEHLALYITGSGINNWNTKAVQADIYKAKGIAESIATLCGFRTVGFEPGNDANLGEVLVIKGDNEKIGWVKEVEQQKLQQFDLRQAVYVIDFNWKLLVQLSDRKITYKEISKYPAVSRDLAIVVDKNVAYATIDQAVRKLNLSRLQSINLFDVFESEKLGTGKKSMAVNFVFLDDEKTLTDKEIELMMSKIIQALENELNAEIRK